MCTHARAVLCLWAWRAKRISRSPRVADPRPYYQLQSLEPSAFGHARSHTAVHRWFECSFIYLFLFFVFVSLSPLPLLSRTRRHAPPSSSSFAHFAFVAPACDFVCYVLFPSQSSHSRPRAFIAAPCTSFHRRIAPPRSPRRLRVRLSSCSAGPVRVLPLLSLAPPLSCPLPSLSLL